MSKGAKKKLVKKPVNKEKSGIQNELDEPEENAENGEADEEGDLDFDFDESKDSENEDN